jgi:cyclase
LDDIREVLRAGADKVALNTAAIRDPDLVARAARRFGSSTIVVSIEAIRKSDGNYEAFTDNGRQETGVDALEWARKVEQLGAGEIMLTSINREGTGKGYDLELTRAVSTSVSIPVIACGGAGKVEDVADVIILGKADAASIASLFHYDFIRNGARTDTAVVVGNNDFLKNFDRGTKSPFSSIVSAPIPALKQYLDQRGVSMAFHG